MLPIKHTLDAHPVRYRAFVSYSHRDSKAAKAIHRRLEGFRIDRDLVGRKTSLGPVPNTLRPIFRDREDFSSGDALKDQTLAALRASAALVVICSPAAAASDHVNEEVRLFKHLHPDRPVIPLIVDGTPGDTRRECFPPALRYELDSEGTISERRINVLAADIRDDADGFDLAIAKVVARLVGLPSDDVFRRAERDRRRKTRLRNAIIALLFVLAVSATGSALYAWQQLKTNDAFLNATLRTATEIVSTAVAQAERYNVPRKATHDLLGKAETLFEDMARLGRPTAELRHRKAWMLIEFARNYELLGDIARQRERALAAQGLLVQLTKEHPHRSDYLLDLSFAQNELGNVLAAGGDLGGALNAYRDAFTIRERLTKTDPANVAWQRDLSVSANKLADVFVSQGRLTDALQHYRAAHAIRLQLSKADPANSGWQRDLAVSHHKIGEVLTTLGNPADALSEFQAAQAIFRSLAASAPTHAGHQRDLAIAHHKVAETLIALGRDREGHDLLLQSASIIAQNVKTDPQNASWQRDLAVTHTKIGDLSAKQGALPEALSFYRSALAIFTRLTAADTKNATWRRDFAICHTKIGDALLAQGALSQAQPHFTESLAVFEALALLDPGNADWQRGLAVAHERLGDIAEAADPATAIRHYERALSIHRALMTSNPDNPEPALAATIPLLRLGALLPEHSAEYYRQALRILRALEAAGRQTADQQATIDWLEGQLR